jgi:hypothetical protein
MSIRRLLQLLDKKVFLTKYDFGPNDPVYGVPKSLYDQMRRILEEIASDANQE